MKLLRLCAIGCAAGLLITGTLLAETPNFKIEVLAPANPGAFTVNAYPVIARLESGRLLCIFSVREAGKSAKMKIATSTSDDNGKTWSVAALLFDHPQAEDDDPSLVVDGGRVLALTTTVPGPEHISRSLIYMRASNDGIHWDEEVLLKTPHRYIAGKIHQGHRLSDGTLVVGYSWDTWAEQNMPPATEGEMNIKSGVLWSSDSGKTWTAGGDMYANIPKTSPHATSGLVEPATVVLADGRLMTLMRTSGTKLYQAWSRNGGITWSTPQPSKLTAHNSPAALWKLDGLRDVVAVWDNSPTGRSVLTAALSSDGGRTWSAPKILATTENAKEVSYPSVVQAKDGTIIAVWQCQLLKGGREIHMARFTRAELLEKIGAAEYENYNLNKESASARSRICTGESYRQLHFCLWTNSQRSEDRHHHGNHHRDQVAQVLRNIEAIVKAAGGTKECIVRCGVFLSDLADFAAMDNSFRKFFGKSLPARTTVQAGLGPLRVEIDAIATRKQARAPRKKT